MADALLVIDLQARIVALPVAPHTGEEVLRQSMRLAEAYRVAGRPVVVVRAERPGVPEQPPGSNLVDGLLWPGDLLVTKRAIGAFHQTDLHEQLQARGVDGITLAGLVTNLGVESTARTGNDYGYALTFVSDAMSGLTAEEHHFAIKHIFPRFGTVLTTDEAIARL